MRALVENAGLADRISLDSAGTGGYHVGEKSDPRTRAAARHRGYELDHRAWQFTEKDFSRFDLVLAMDGSNLSRLKAMVRGGVPRDVRLFRSFDPTAEEGAEVPDPWYGGDEGFEDVLDQCERACTGLLAYVKTRL
jgi:protein-tyrosine phosphatase